VHRLAVSVEGTFEVYGLHCWALTRRARAATWFAVEKQSRRCAPRVSANSPHSQAASMQGGTLTIRRRFPATRTSMDLALASTKGGPRRPKSLRADDGVAVGTGLFDRLTSQNRNPLIKELTTAQLHSWCTKMYSDACVQGVNSGAQFFHALEDDRFQLKVVKVANEVSPAPFQ
jgi:hypothetical protein